MYSTFIRRQGSGLLWWHGAAANISRWTSISSLAACTRRMRPQSWWTSPSSCCRSGDGWGKLCWCVEHIGMCTSVKHKMLFNCETFYIGLTNRNFKTRYKDTFKYHVSWTHGEISVRIFITYFFHRCPNHKLCFLSCRPFVINTTFSTDLVVSSVSWLGQLTVENRK